MLTESVGGRREAAALRPEQGYNTYSRGLRVIEVVVGVRGGELLY